MISGLPPFYDRNRDRMYKKILSAELRFPAIMNPEARSICRGMFIYDRLDLILNCANFNFNYIGMLQRDPLQRLGYYGAQEIKNHPFFASLNWDDVYYKRVNPPFKPVVNIYLSGYYFFLLSIIIFIIIRFVHESYYNVLLWL